MQRGDTFLMGNPHGRVKHLWIVISDSAKHGGTGVIVNLTTNKERSGDDCSLTAADHPWIDHQCWVCFGDALCLCPEKWKALKAGIPTKMIVPQATLAKNVVDRIVSEAKTSTSFPPICLRYLD